MTTTFHAHSCHRRRSTVRPSFVRHPYPRSTSAATNYVGIGKQSVKGTAVTPTVFPPYQGAVDLSAGMEGDDIRQAGTGPFVNRTMKTRHDPSGGFGMAVRPRTFAQLCAWFLGADGSAAASSLFDHTATPAETNTWLTVEQAAGISGDIIERYPDALLKTMSIMCEGNGDLMSSFGWASLSALWQGTAATQSYETGVSGSTPGGPFRAAESTYTIDGVTAGVGDRVQSFTLDLEWKLDEDIRLSRVTRSEFLKLELSGKIKIKQLIDSATMQNEYRKIIYGSTAGTVPIRNFFQGGAFIAAFDNALTTTNSRLLTITAPVCDWKTSPYTALSPDGATMYLEREGTIRKDTGAFITIVSRTADSAAY